MKLAEYCRNVGQGKKRCGSPEKLIHYLSYTWCDVESAAQRKYYFSIYQR